MSAKKMLAEPDRIPYHTPLGGGALGNRIRALAETKDQDKGQTDGLAGLRTQAAAAADFLKALGHDGRLMLLCHLTSGPKSVTELEKLLEARQAVVSQQLARLRHEGLVSARREGQAIYYSIRDPKVGRVIAVLGEVFCNPGADPG